jgi:hypothetical protein
VPINFYQQDQRVSSVMIEINRRLYTNTAHYFNLQKNLSDVMSKVIKKQG